MKVLVPVDFEHADEVEFTAHLIEEKNWPAETEFHLLNIINNKNYPGEPCGEPDCEVQCHCLEKRVRKLSNLLTRLERERPQLRVFMEVATGDPCNVIAERLNEDPAVRLLI